MEFTTNDIAWSIKDTSKEWLIDKYNSEHDEKCTYVFGLCDYATHIIHINEELFFNEKIRTLKHELTHCWLWSHGAICETYTEEELCNRVSAMVNFIYEITQVYIKDCMEK